MKRRIALALVLIMLFALVLPQTALAVTRYYLTVSITDKTYTVTGTTGYLSLTDDSLTGGVVQVVNEKYAGGEGEFKIFGSAAMKAIVASGLSAYETSGHVGWAGWVDPYAKDVTIQNANPAAVGIDLKAKLVDLSTTVNALTEGVDYQLSYTPSVKVAPPSDGAYGKTYTVTITLNSYTTGGDDTGSRVGRVIVIDTDNGDASAYPTTSPSGGTITVTVNPDEGYVISRIIVTDKNGNRIYPTYIGNNQYTFIMPEGDVTVEPVFRKKTISPAESGVAELLNVEDHTAFMVGDNKGNFRPNDSITRAEVAQIFYRLLKDQNVQSTKKFDDVADNAWYAPAVNTLASMGILNGTSETTFEPNRSITRAEFAAISTRFAKLPSASVSFTDVPAGYWAYDNIAAAAAFGWCVGNGRGQFNPRSAITRTETAAIVNRMLGRLADFDAIDAGAGRRFPDVSKTFWGFYDIVEATTAHEYTFDSELLHEKWN